MRLKLSLTLLLTILALASVRAQVNVQLPTIPANTFYVTNYGAIADGVFTNTTAIQNTINAASAAGGGSVVVTPGNYLCGPLTLANAINFQINANATLTMLPLSKYPGGDVSPANFISASSKHDVEISGDGVIEGQGLPWWKDSETNSAAVRPNMINFSACSKVLIQDITCSNSPSPFLVVKGKAGNVTIQRVKIYAPSSGAAVNPSHNTDALDLAETNAIVRDCTFSTGDDNIAIGSSASASYGILVTNCTFGTGHGCSIGSYTSGTVSNLTVVNCSFTGTDNGIRLKSQRGRGGMVQNCNYHDLTMTNVAWPFLIYSYYEFGLGTLTGVNPTFAATTAITNPTTLNSTTPVWRDITFSNITATTGTSSRPPLMIWGLPESPAADVIFRNVSLTSSSTRSPGLYNVTNIQFVDCNFIVPAATKDFQIFNAQMLITNSTPAGDLLLLDGLTTNNWNNALELDNALAALSNTNLLDRAPLALAGSILFVTNHLALTHDVPLRFQLGASAATVSVRSNLLFDGTFDFTAGPGFGAGNYTLFTYGGSLSQGTPTIRGAPPGYDYGFDTSTFGQVKLVVTAPAPPQIVSTSLLGNQFIASGTSGYTNGTSHYLVLSTTNVTLPLNQWSAEVTNLFDTTGSLHFTNAIGPGVPMKFFRLQLQ